MKLLTPNTRTPDAGERATVADIGRMTWLAGVWEGDGPEGQVEQIWSAPRAGTMLGLFRLTHENRPQFFELMCISEDAGGLSMRMKHFHPDLRGWEERDQVMEVPLLELGEQEAFFDGLTLRRHGETLQVFVAAKGQGDHPPEFAYHYRRCSPERTHS